MKKLIVLAVLFLASSITCQCPSGQVQSACFSTYNQQQNQNCSSQCVDSIALLVGGSDLAGWRSDMEFYGWEGYVSLADFPYKIDAPVGWWAKGRVIVCGGRNWDVDQPESRCWQFSHCQNR